MPEYLVTGGAGFIGSHITETLLEQGKSVRVIDNFSTGREENIASFRDKIELMEGDFSDFDTAKAAVEGVTYVIHQGAIPSVARSVDDPVSSNRANITGTLNLLVAARDGGVKRFVYASSSSAYGDSETLPKVETMPYNPISPYALTKLAGEIYCRQFHALYGFETVSLRYFNVYGPRQNPKSKYAAVIPNFVFSLMQGKSPVIDGDGEQTRGFTFVEDVVRANLLACQASPEAAGKAHNISGTQRTSVNELFSMIASILGADTKAEHGPPRKGDIKHSYADISSAAKYLGYTPQVTVEEGLKRTVDWFVGSTKKT